MNVIKEIANRADLIYAQCNKKGIANLSQEELIGVTSSLQEIVVELETYLVNADFGELDEIECFKNIKPRIVGRTMFFHRLSVLDSLYLASSTNCHIAFFDSVRSEIREYIAANRTIFHYYKSGSRTLDTIYFVRNKNFEANIMDIYSDGFSPLSTIHDKTFANFVCYGLLNDYISDRINDLEQEEKVNEPKQSLVTWSSSKISLVELGYAIYAAGVVNGGSATIREILDALSIAFNKDLGNFYRTFADIKSRGGGSTMFLEDLKSRLLEKIESEEL